MTPPATGHTEPGAAPAEPADAHFDALVRARFEALTERFPTFATYLGLHQHDHRLADGTREAIEDDVGAARRFLQQLDEIDRDRLSAANRIELDLARHVTRLTLFEDDAQRIWERRVSASDELGDGVFLLFARHTRPLNERLAAIASRLEAGPRLLEEHRTRLAEKPPMRLWNELEIEAAQSLPSLFNEVSAAARGALGDGHPEVVRLDSASTRAQQALEDYVGWIRQQLGRANDEFGLGRERYDELIALRALDGLSTSDILEIGEEQLARSREARRSVAVEIDPAASEEEVLDRIKSDHPADFDQALVAYRRAMSEARQFVIDNDIATMPAGESLSVIATPRYLRKVMPFAAYFPPARFDPDAVGIYVVTPSVGGEAGAMREHNYASIYNTSIHEAYPGHHQQLSAANAHPSLVRLLVDGPEFVEGWAMYCEQMMREQGFDTEAEHRLMMYTDAVWRACRIILDVRLHRGEIGLGEAVEFLVRQTGFERPNATAEVNRYTYTPTYQLSYLLGKVLLLRLRADEQARLGERFSLRAFHDALLAAGSLPVSFQRRLLAGEGTDGWAAEAAR